MGWTPLPSYGLNTHFPEGSKLHKIFNQNTFKISYICSTNLKSIIQAHNKNLLSEPSSTDKLCNCKNTTQCPFNSQCLQKGIYNATILQRNITKVILKTRYNQHKSSLKPNETTQTTLSAYIMKNNLNHTNISYSIIYKTTCKAPPTNQKCALYTT